MKRKDEAIIRYILENKSEELNILKVSKAIKMDYKNVYLIIKRLEKELLVRLETFGQSSRIKLISQIHPLIFEAEYNRKNEILKNKNLAVMLQELKKAIKSKYYILFLFGSYAKKTQTKNSDIDLMFIVPDGKEEIVEKEVHRAADLLPLPLHCLVFSEKQFLSMINAKEPNVGQEALKNNIILSGVETYYELIQ